jgi:hypothetical protein
MTGGMASGGGGEISERKRLGGNGNRGEREKHRRCIRGRNGDRGEKKICRGKSSIVRSPNTIMSFV